MGFDMIVIAFLVFFCGFSMGTLLMMLWAICEAEKERDKDD